MIPLTQREKADEPKSLDRANLSRHKAKEKRPGDTEYFTNYLSDWNENDDEIGSIKVHTYGEETETYIQERKDDYQPRQTRKT